MKRLGFGIWEKTLMAYCRRFFFESMQRAMRRLATKTSKKRWVRSMWAWMMLRSLRLEHDSRSTSLGFFSLSVFRMELLALATLLVILPHSHVSGFGMGTQTGWTMVQTRTLILVLYQKHGKFGPFFNPKIKRFGAFVPSTFSLVALC